MNISLVLITIILFCACIFLILKLCLIKHSIKEIENSFTYILKADTNNMITISSSDKDIKNLTININNNLTDLRKQTLQYKSGNQELKNIITNISHELRTPLTAIKGYINLIQQENLSKKKKQYLKIVEKKSDELTELTKQLFEFSKLMDIDIELKKERCCINEILEETLASYYNIFKEKNIIPKVSICDNKIYKTINRISIIRVFENILSNVLKYSNGDFKVIMNENGTIIFSNKASSLDAPTVEKIFERYFSVENAKESTGIGLSIAKKLIELNNGSIKATYCNEYLIIEIGL